MTYQPALESVKTHPMPDWYNDAKFGIFISLGNLQRPDMCAAWRTDSTGMKFISIPVLKVS